MPDPNPAALRQVDKVLVSRYSRRLAEYGDDPRTLGWDKRQSQAVRFGVAAELFNFGGKRVLDVGCGLAHFLEFLTETGMPPAQYTGCDINPALIDHCKRQHPSADFCVANLLLDPIPGGPWDVVVMFGLVNFRFREFDNFDFLRAMLKRSLQISDRAVVVDMLTSVRDTDYEQEAFVYYYDPAAVLNMVSELNPHFTLRHDYRSIPQREMMLVLRKPTTCD